MEFNGSCTAHHIPIDAGSCDICDQKCYRPVSFDQGAPIDHKPARFFQKYSECIWQQDVDNEILSNRRFGLLPVEPKVFPRPLADPCMPTESMLKRQGNPPNYNGMPILAKDIKDVGKESDLIGLWGKQSRCQINDGINNDYCTKVENKFKFDSYNNNTKYCRLGTSDDIKIIMDLTSIDHDSYKKQLYTDFTDESKNINKASPHVFRNNSRAKLQRH